MNSKRRCAVFIILLKIIVVLSYKNVTVQDQLLEFAKSVQSPALLTTTFGAPVLIQDTISINRPRPLLNNFFIESLTQLNRERIPERIAHAKGSGVFGYFQVLHDLKDICKAKVFDTVGKVTPLVARFSTALQRTGGSDIARDLRGFAIKFYTEEGNLDMLNINVDMFLVKDPIFFPTTIHAFGQNPRTNLEDLNAQWDYLTRRPETLSMFMRIFGDHGIPDGYRHMIGRPIHTFELLNRYGNRTYVRFLFNPEAGIKNLTTQQAQKIQGEDLDYSSRDLYEAILNKNFPSWLMHVQTIAENDVHKVNFDIFDVTRFWPLEKIPLRTVRRVVLNKIPDNFFADTEQAAFNPGNLVPGMRGVDAVFEARTFAYRDAQLYRLGKNYYKIRVNCPLSGANTYYKDGVPPVLVNGGGAPTYFPNSFNGPKPLNIKEPEKLTTRRQDPAATNFDQAREIYRRLDENEKCRTVENIVASVSPTVKFIQDRAVKLYKLIDQELGLRIEYGLKIGIRKTSACKSL